MHSNSISRRTFMQQATVAGAGLALAASATGTATAQGTFKPFKKAIQYGKLPDLPTDKEKFALLKDCGFDGIEAYPMADLEAAKRMGEEAREAGVPIHSVTYGGWKAPMSSPDPEIIKQGHAEIENGLRTAKAMGADTMLLVPAVVNDTVRYQDAWVTSQKNIRPMIPLAEELEIVIGVENVWNKFLLSPIEFAQYVDEFESPWVRAYFDVANVILFGYPQDWIRTLGNRICKVHFKDFKREDMSWPSLPYEGDTNWAEVRKALDEVGYTGWCTEECPRGDEAWLRELSRRLTLIGEGAATA